MSDTEKSASTVIIESIRSFLRKAILHVHSKIMLAGAHGDGRIYQKKKNSHSILFPGKHIILMLHFGNTIMSSSSRGERNGKVSQRLALDTRLCVAVCYALLWMRPLSRSWAECSVVISCGKVDYDKSG
jgi:hypothetical protein